MAIARRRRRKGNAFGDSVGKTTRPRPGGGSKGKSSPGGGYKFGPGPNDWSDGGTDASHGLDGAPFQGGGRPRTKPKGKVHPIGRRPPAGGADASAGRGVPGGPTRIHPQPGRVPPGGPRPAPKPKPATGMKQADGGFRSRPSGVSGGGSFAYGREVPAPVPSSSNARRRRG